jgi:hypothetical protein
MDTLSSKKLLIYDDDDTGSYCIVNSIVKFDILIHYQICVCRVYFIRFAIQTIF